MKNTRKAFTLVELIVVITILAILSTIVFISLQGHTKDAKDAKVVSDVNQILQDIAVKTAENNGITLSDTVNEDTNFEIDKTTYKVNSWTLLNDAGVTYEAGPVNYAKLGIKQSDFEFDGKDGNKHPYITAFVVHKNFVTYEVAGNTLDAAGNPTVVLRGTYYQVDPAQDAAGLISAKWDSATIATDGKKVPLY